MSDLLEEVVIQRMIPDWVRKQLLDIHNYRRQGPAAVREHNRVLAIGQALFKPRAPGIIWDLRGLHEGAIVPLDFSKPIQTHLNLPSIAEELDTFPDQELKGFLLECIQLKAALEMQLVFLPHLESLKSGLESVESELLKLEEKGWYGLFGHTPFVPCRMQPQGAVPRVLEDR